MFPEYSLLEIISGFCQYCKERLLSESLHHNRYPPVNDFRKEELEKGLRITPTYPQQKLSLLKNSDSGLCLVNRYANA